MSSAQAPGRGVRLLVASLVLFALGHASWTAWSASWTVDESVHLSWSRRVLETGSTDRDDIGTYNSKTPVSMLNVLARMSAERFRTSDRVERLAARLPNVVEFALLLATTRALAGWLAGPWAAALATAGAALDPNLVAHSSVVTVDTPYALATLLTLWAGAALARRPRPAGGALLGLALGFAFVAKFSAVLLLGGLVMLPLGSPRPVAPGYARRLGLALVVAGAVSWAMVCAGYLFLEIGAPLGTLGFQSGVFRGIARVAPEFPSPVPAAFLTGLDRSIADDSTQDWPVYILGWARPGGVWFYFLVLWLLKTPLLTLIAQAVGLGRLGLSRIGFREPATRFLLANLLLTLLYFSLLFRTQIGYRFVLMCVPLAWVLAAQGLTLIAASRARTALLVLAAAAGLAENLVYLGNPLAFTNVAVFPKREVFRLIGDSSIDWKQNEDRIQEVLKERGIRTRLNPVHLLPGHVTLTVFDLTQPRPDTRWIREHLDPVEHYLHTYLAFEVTPEQFDRFMDANRRFPVVPDAAERCGARGAEREAIGTGLPFSVDEEPARATAWRVCVEAKDRADVIFKSRKGTIRVGHYGPEGHCETNEVEDGQELWFRLEPGLHALCLVEPRMRRAWLPYRIEARWFARGRARLSIEETARPGE
jgi:Dolichyl-phosphate-mannose-protein mannosyltransferase